MSKIEWTEKTWNPIIGCDKVSEGCKNCYAMRMAWRLMHNPKTAAKYEGVAKKTEGGAINWTGNLNFLSDVLTLPLRTKKPTVWFVNSMSDLFHDEVPNEWIDAVMQVIEHTPHHTYQVLTKRPGRMAAYFNAYYPYLYKKAGYKGLENLWLGVSVEHQKAADERIPHLLATPAAVRFVSCEPLLGPVDLTCIRQYNGEGEHIASYQVLWPINNCGDSNRPAIDWVIVGGESGPNARPMHPDWVRMLRKHCHAAGVPFFFKQWGEYRSYSFFDNGRVTESIPLAHMSNPSLYYTGSEWLPIFGKLDAGIAFRHAVACKLGKKAAGRMIDGREWNEVPAK
jgi:protein gp37